MCIDGKETAALVGANDEAIVVTAAEGQTSGRFECALVADTVVAETQEVWARHWREADEWSEKLKAAKSNRK